MGFEEKIKIIKDETGKEIVQMDIDVFKSIENLIEDQGMLKLIQENNSKDKLGLEDALEYYSKLQKKD